MKYKYITPPQNCTGCGLCDNVCSHNAISMVWSKEGFLIPQVNTEACINCGLCSKQCIALEEKQEYTDDVGSVAAWGGWNKNESTHLQSSSGGVFSALAEHILAEGGCVFGVVWKDKHTAIFEKAESKEELARMRGSKYTPALPGKVYQQVKAELKSGRQVLFSGTPCQVHALKKYLRKPYVNLLTVDIVCHGMPSHLILEKYIDEDEKKTSKTIDHVSFRDKPEGWQKFHVTRHYTDGSASSATLAQDTYMRMFLCDKALNYICYNCPYAHIPRQGDISLGDYWGVQKIHPDWPIDKGISAILANTAKGIQCLQQLSDKLTLCEEPFDKIYSKQDAVYVRPAKQIPKERELILAILPFWTLEKVLHKLVNRVKFGPIHLQRNGLTHRILRKGWRIIKSLKS